MPNFSDYHSLDIEAAQVAIVMNNDTEGTGLTIDTSDCEAVLFSANVGIEGDTLSGSVKIEYALEHADDDGAGAPDSWEKVTEPSQIICNGAGAPAETTGIFYTIDADAEAPAMVKAAYIGPKKFVRLDCETTGTLTNGFPVAAVAIKSHLKRSLTS